VIETPLHPHARHHLNGKLIGEAFVSLNFDLSQASDAFRDLSDRMILAQMSMISLQKPLSLITLSGV
jgi:hypothetical protein